MTSVKDNILEFNQYIKSDKMPYIIYGDMEYLIKILDGHANNPEKYLITKIDQPISCGYSASTISTFDNIEDKRTLYCRKVL